MWGIRAKSATLALPETSSPRATAILLDVFFILSDCIIFFKGTNSGARLGSSIPTRERPGIGASILIVPVGAARAKAKSRSSAVIFESLVPRATSNAYWVTAGPILTSTTLAVIPNDSRVFSICAALSFMSPLSAFPVLVSENIVIGGYFQTLSSPGTLLTSFGASATCSLGLTGSLWLIVSGLDPPDTLSSFLPD